MKNNLLLKLEKILKKLYFRKIIFKRYLLIATSRSNKSSTIISELQTIIRKDNNYQCQNFLNCPIIIKRDINIAILDKINLKSILKTSVPNQMHQDCRMNILNRL